MQQGCLHSVSLVFQHVRDEGAQLFAIASVAGKQIKADQTREMKLDASLTKSNRARTHTLAGQQVLRAVMYPGILLGYCCCCHVNRSPPDLAVTGISSVTGIFVCMKLCPLTAKDFNPSIKSNPYFHLPNYFESSENGRLA